MEGYKFDIGDKVFYKDYEASCEGIIIGNIQLIRMSLKNHKKRIV